MAEQRTEPQPVVPAGDSGGSVISGPAKQATGGGRASSSVATVDGRSRGDRSANLAPENGRRDVNPSGGGCTDGGGDSHGRANRTWPGGSKGERSDAQPQLRQQDSEAASPRRTTRTPPSPASITSDSPRQPGGPLRALSPLALFGRIERSRSQSPRWRSPTSRNDQTNKHQGINIKTAGQQGRRETAETGRNREVAPGGVVVGTSRSTDASPPGGGSGSNETPRIDYNGGALTELIQADDDHLRDGAEFSHDVASAATAWLASFEQRFMPCLVAEAGARAREAGVEGARKAAVDGNLAGSSCRAQGPEAKDGMLPQAISRVLHEVNGRASERVSERVSKMHY